jgi:serine/threonine protein kinase
MAETFVAVRRGPGGFEQHVCIKRILPAFESDQEFVESFLNEAKTSAALRHGNIVQVLDFGVADGTHYLALELIDGLDLRALLAGDTDERVALDPELCTLIAADLCSALEHAHSAGPGRIAVVHRDVSPSNVLVSTAGEIKLTDFGIARATTGRQRTATGIIKGKVPYMPPEYIEHGTFDPRGDLFSLGVLLYELLAGERPFDGHSDLDTIRRIVAGQHAHLGTLVRGAAPQLVQCIERLLVVRPAERFASAGALLEALPTINTHRVRRRLGELVRERLSQRSQPPDPSANTLPRGDAPLVTPAMYTPGPAALPPPDRGNSSLPLTHTREPLLLSEPETRPEVRRPSARPLWALGAAGALLCVVGALALQRVLAGNQVADQVVAPSPIPASADAGLVGNTSAGLAKTDENTDWPPTPVEFIVNPNAPGPYGSDAGGEVVPSTPEPTPAPNEGHAERVRQPKRTPRPAVPRPAVPDEPRASAEGQAELKVYVQPYGDVWIDGKRLGQAPVTLKLEPGVHEVGVGDGRPREKRSVTLSPGEKRALEIQRRDVGESVE